MVDEVVAALERGESLETLRALLVRYRASGLSQRAAYDALHALRSRLTGRDEDRLLELMDIVAGFCAPHLRVW
jgi:hypothetical protein